MLKKVQYFVTTSAQRIAYDGGYIPVPTGKTPVSEVLSKYREADWPSIVVLAKNQSIARNEQGEMLPPLIDVVVEQEHIVSDAQAAFILATQGWKE